MKMQSYVNFFRHMSPYVRAHRGKTFVIAFSGDALLESANHQLMSDVVLLQSLGVRVTLVHGARPQIEQRLSEAGIETPFKDSARITNVFAMEHVKQAVGSARLTIESCLSKNISNFSLQIPAAGVIGGNFVVAKPKGVIDGVDYLHTGEIRRIDSSGIQRQLDNNAIVLLSPIGFSPTGESFNLSYQDVATEAAIALEADKLIFVGKKNGISLDGIVQNSFSLIALKALLSETNLLSSNDTKLLTCAYRACKKKVARVHLIGFSEDGALLSELFTRDGIGTLVSQDYSETLRAATIDDVSEILNLISPLEKQGKLAKRSRELLETEISYFFVADHPDGFLLGCAALYPMGIESSRELACVVTHPDFQDRGIASRLLALIEQQAADQAVLQLFVLTTQATHWFQEKGFIETTFNELPEDRKLLYNYQRNSKILKKLL